MTGEPEIVGDGGPMAQAAETSINAGRVPYRLTLPDLVTRCVFSPYRQPGAYIISGTEKGLSHWTDAGDGVRNAQVLAHAEGIFAGRAGARHLHAVPLLNAVNSSIIVTDELDRVITVGWTAPLHLDGQSPLLDRLISERFSTKPPQFSLERFLTGWIDMMADHATYLLQEWAIVATQNPPSLDLFTCNAIEGVMLPSLLEPVSGPLLAEQTFTAILS